MIAQSRPTAIGTPIAASTMKAGSLGFLILGLTVAVLANIGLPLISSERDEFLALVAVGLVTCMAGAGSSIQALGWRHPINVIGIGLGLASLVLIALVLTGNTAPLTWLADAAGGSRPVSPERVAFVGLAAMLLTKWGLGFARLAARYGC